MFMIMCTLQHAIHGMKLTAGCLMTHHQKQIWKHYKVVKITNQSLITNQPSRRQVSGQW
jgi:hypothetical protein